jgi:hypothetical protein
MAAARVGGGDTGAGEILATCWGGPEIEEEGDVDGAHATNASTTTTTSWGFI